MKDFHNGHEEECAKVTQSTFFFGVVVSNSRDHSLRLSLLPDYKAYPSVTWNYILLSNQRHKSDLDDYYRSLKSQKE